MRILTDPSSNLSPALVERYGITVLPADASANDVAAQLRELTRNHREMIVVCSSRKLNPVYDSALTASRILKSMPSYADVQVSVVDASLTDLGAGIVTLVCAESRKSRRQRREIADAARALGERSCFYYVQQKTSGFIQGLTSQLTGKLPILAMHDGDVRSSGQTTKADIPRQLLNTATKDYPLQQSIFAAVLHGKDATGAEELANLLCEHYDVKSLIKREATYAQDVFGCIIMPARGLPWPIELPSEG